MDQQTSAVNQFGTGSQSENVLRRRVYKNLDRDEYRIDHNQAVRGAMQAEAMINPIQKLMKKRQQEVPEDQFKSEQRSVQLRKVEPSGSEAGMILLQNNLDLQKRDRDLKRQQYVAELNRQIAEKHAITGYDGMADKISNVPAPQLGPRPQQRRMQYEGRGEAARGPSMQSNQYSDGQQYFNDGVSKDRPESYATNKYLDAHNNQGQLVRGHSIGGLQEDSISMPNQQPGVSRGDLYSGKSRSGLQGQSQSIIRPSAFKQASTNILAQGGTQQNNEFFDRFFGNPEERKKKQTDAIKQEMVNELNMQIQMKKDREKREKQQRYFEDVKAEERYVNEMKKLNDQAQNERSVRKQGNIFGDGVNDIEIQGLPPAELKRELSANRYQPGTQRFSQADEVSIPNSRPGGGSAINRSPQEPSVSVAPRDMPELSFAREGGALVPAGMDSYSMATQQRNPPKYQEYTQRIADYTADKMEDKKRELRMNTNLLYQQIIDLRVDE